MEIKNQVIDRVDNPNIVAEVSKIAAAGWIFQQYHIPYYLHPMRCTISYI